MRAIRVHETGDSSVLKLEDIDQPIPSEGQALIKVDTVGVNFVETYQRAGVYKMQFPYTPGGEVGGTIIAVGDPSIPFKVGERVVTSAALGAYAEYTLAPIEKLIPVPDRVSFHDAVALVVQGLTAHYLSFSTYALNPGDIALVHAAGGGTGALLVQVAKKCGATVIGCVSNEEKAKIARDSGADWVINYVEKDFAEEVKTVTAGAGVKVVYDSVGKVTWEKSLSCLRPRGLMVLYGQSSGPVGLIDPQILNARGSLYLTRPTLAHYASSSEELLNRAHALFGWIADGSLTVRIDKSFALAEAAKAHDYLQGRFSKGKVLLIP